jgi:hypothetical protein
MATALCNLFSEAMGSMTKTKVYTGGNSSIMKIIATKFGVA